MSTAHGERVGDANDAFPAATHVVSHPANDVDPSHADSSHADSSHADSSHADSSHADSSHVDSSWMHSTAGRPSGFPSQRTDTEGSGSDAPPGQPGPDGGTGPVGGATGAPLRLLLVGSSGGHLAQLTALEPWSRNHDRHWVSFDTPDAVSILTGEQVTWAHHPTTRNVPNLLRNLLLAWRVLRTHRPDVVLSTGAGVALPFFVLARALAVPTVYLEVYDRVDTATLTGRLCRPFATRMLVQWAEQSALYRDAEVVGCVL